MSKPVFYINGIPVAGRDPEGDPAIVSLLQGNFPD